MEWRAYRFKPEVEPMKGPGAGVEAEPRTRLVEPIEVSCPCCKGSGREPETGYLCKACQGSGVVIKGREVIERELGFFDVNSVHGLPYRGFEMEVLEKIADVGGRIHYQRLAMKMKRNNSYVCLLCKSLAKKGYLDFTDSKRVKNWGIAEITLKGIEDLRMRGLLKRKGIK